MHFYHVFLACSIYSFRYFYHIFISYNLIFPIMSSTCNILYLVNLYLHVLYQTLISYDIYLYISIFIRFTLYFYILSIPFMCSSFMPYHFIRFFYTPLHIKSTFIAISCSYLSLFLSCIPIDFTHAISTLSTTIIFSDVDTECH